MALLNIFKINHLLNSIELKQRDQRAIIKFSAKMDTALIYTKASFRSHRLTENRWNERDQYLNSSLS